jgi:hypothetical protein
MSGLVTLRASVWQVNYPGTHRARIAGRLQFLRFLIALLTSTALSALFDKDPSYYRFAYPAVALIGGLALLPLRRMRIRGERAELREFREHLRQGTGDGPTANGGLWHGLSESLAILRTDRKFAGYMAAQFLLGSANFMVDPLLVAILTKRLFVDKYFLPQLFMFVIPVVLLLITIRFWGPYFDRVGVLRFRVFNSLFWVASYALVTIAMAVLWLGEDAAFGLVVTLLAAARVCNGIARGGGAVAWPLGHLHFAGRHQAELYMGIHVALTGLRGLVMPFVGVALHHYLGWGSFVVAMLTAGTANVLFLRLHRRDRRTALEAEAHAEDIGAPADGADQAS